MSLAQRQQSIPLESTAPNPGWLDFAGYLVAEIALLPAICVIRSR